MFNSYYENKKRDKTNMAWRAIRKDKPMNKMLIVGLLLLSMFAVGIRPVDAQTYEQARKTHIQKVMTTSDGVQIKNSVNKYSKMYSVEPNLIFAIITVESNFNRNARSAGGCSGLMQMAYGTFKARNVGTNIFDIDQNIHAGTKHVAGLKGRYRGDIVKTLAAYNMGGGRVSITGATPNIGVQYANKVLYNKKILDSITF